MAMIVSTVETIGDEALTNSIIDRSVTELQDTLTTKLKEYVFSGCVSLKTVVFGAVTKVDGSALIGCTALTTADFHSTVSFSSYVFENCSALKTLILRSETRCTLSASNSFNGTPIKSGTGYIYVPAALVDSYKTASGWSTYASQIRAIEDYPEVCSTAGKVWGAVEGVVRLSNYYGAAYGNGVLVTGNQASGDNPLYYSEGGATLTESNPIKLKLDGGVYFFGDLWLACGARYSAAYSNIYYSEDGKTWLPCSGVGVDGKGRCAATNSQGLFVAGTTSGLYYSEDGKTWTQSNITSGTILSVAFADGLWVAGRMGSGLYYSEDGKTWTQSNITDQRFQFLFNANGLWVAGTDSSSYKGAYYSEDGKTWTQSNFNKNAFNACFYSGGLWVAATGDGIYTSVNGKTWEKIISGSYKDVLCVNGRWVACGTGLSYSEDGAATWVKSNITSGTMVKLCYGDGVLFATGAGLIYYSE